MTSHSAAASMWTAHLTNLSINNAATTWPAPQVKPSTKDPTPCTKNAVWHQFV